MSVIKNLMSSFFRPDPPPEPAAPTVDPFSVSKSLWYDTLTSAIMRQHLTPTSVCVDVGCHMGSVLDDMILYAPEGTFFAFEPLPDLFADLQKRYTQPNVRLSNVALCNEEGTTTFNYVMTNPAYSGIVKRRYDRPFEQDMTITVQTARLDRVLADAGSPKVDLIKIDVEGAEYLVMQGAEQTLKRDRPLVVFEHGLGGTDCYGVRPEQVYELLVEGCGLKISLLEDCLLGRDPLTREKLVEQFDQGKNFQFVAHR
jgi:FkbM family methyltransferase